MSLSKSHSPSQFEVHNHHQHSSMLNIVAATQQTWDDAHQQIYSSTSTQTCLLLCCFTSILLLGADRLNEVWLCEGQDFECMEKILLVLELLAASSVVISCAGDLVDYIQQ